MPAARVLSMIFLITWGSCCRGLAIPSRQEKSDGASADLKDSGGSDGGEPCKPDFMEEFFRLLSGPVGKEAEALVAASLKLLQENDRVNLASLLRSHSRAETAPVGSLKQRRLSLSQASKREMQFNPSGWRRKRDVSRLEEFLGNGGEGVLGLGAGEMGVREPRYFAVTDPILGALAKRDWENERMRDFQSYRQGGKLKRKPLEFNPSGW